MDMNNTILLPSDEIMKQKRDAEIIKIIDEVYAALKEKGYDPISQLAGYILSGDPTYITAYKGARALITKVCTFEMLEFLLEKYLQQ